LQHYALMSDASVCLSACVCVCVCLLETLMNASEIDETTEMPQFAILDWNTGAI